VKTQTVGTTVSVLEQVMIQLKTTRTVSQFVRAQQLVMTITNGAAHFWNIHAAGILRFMILMLVGLLFVLLGLVTLTGRIEIGVPVIAGVLFIGFSATQFSR
jgi:hypothetical protein